MYNNSINVAAGVPHVSVANVAANTEKIKEIILIAEENNVDILVFPELSITSSTCGDLFFNNLLISAAKESLFELADFTAQKSVLAIVGLPCFYNEKLYNCAAVLQNGRILQIIPKSTISSNRFSSEARYFCSANSIDDTIEINNIKIPFN